MNEIYENEFVANDSSDDDDDEICAIEMAASTVEFNGANQAPICVDDLSVSSSEFIEIAEPEYDSASERSGFQYFDFGNGVEDESTVSSLLYFPDLVGIHDAQVASSDSSETDGESFMDEEEEVDVLMRPQDYWSFVTKMKYEQRPYTEEQLNQVGLQICSHMNVQMYRNVNHTGWMKDELEEKWIENTLPSNNLKDYFDIEDNWIIKREIDVETGQITKRGLHCEFVVYSHICKYDYQIYFRIFL